MASFCSDSGVILLGEARDDLPEDFIEPDGDLPIGIVRLEFPQVGNVADD